MKKLTLLAALFMTSLCFGQGSAQTMQFWDGSFAYNKLIVKEHEFQNNILTLDLSGSTLHLGSQIENTPKGWGSADRVTVSVYKRDCQFDFEAKDITCAVKNAFGVVTWTINGRVSKTLKTPLQNLKVRASLADNSTHEVQVDFTIAESQFFSPANEDISVHFDVFDF